MAKLPVVTPREAIRALEKAGFEQVRQKGSHVSMKKDDPVGTRRVTVPVHSKDLATGTLRAIIRGAGMTVDEFRANL